MPTRDTNGSLMDTGVRRMTADDKDRHGRTVAQPRMVPSEPQWPPLSRFDPVTMRVEMVGRLGGASVAAGDNWSLVPGSVVAEIWPVMGSAESHLLCW